MTMRIHRPTAVPITTAGALLCTLLAANSPVHAKSRTCVPCKAPVRRAHGSNCPGPNPIGMGMQENSGFCCYMGEDYSVKIRSLVCKASFGAVPHVYAWAYCGGTESCTQMTKYGHNYAPDAYHTSACCDEMGNPCGQSGHCVYVGDYALSTRGCQDVHGNDLLQNSCNWHWDGCTKCKPVNCPIIASDGGVPGQSNGGPLNGQQGCAQRYDVLGLPHCLDPGSCPSRWIDGKAGMCRCDWKGYP